MPLNERYSFGTFVIGKSNELAAAAAHAVAEAPGKAYNPLFIYGATGLGKTHLMQAIAHAVLERSPQTRAVYMSGEQFTNEVIEHIHGQKMQEFRRRYRNDLDLLLLDDVHFLERKESTQEEFFHTFNALYEAGKQIVLTSDRSPKELPGLEGRLVSRFDWGMVADIGQPDLEHRTAILRKKAEQDHLELTIPDDVLQFIAEHVRSSVRELEGCIIKLLLFASLKHREITIDLAREALSDKIKPAHEDDGGAAGRHAGTFDRPGPGSRGAPLGRDAGGAEVEGPHQAAHGAAAGGDVPGPRSPRHATGGDRAGIRRARSLDGDSQSRQGVPAARARSRLPRARHSGAERVVRIADVGNCVEWCGQVWTEPAGMWSHGDLPQRRARRSRRNPLSCIGLDAEAHSSTGSTTTTSISLW